jgi:DNA-binding NarL/FixJ family response regulator
VIRVLVVDDHPVVREGVIMVLGDQPDLTVAGAAGTAAEAIVLAARLAPDVALLDLELPEVGGLAALPALLEASPGTRVVIFSAYGTEERVRGALADGARGYLLKGASAAAIAQAVRDVHRGGYSLDPAVAAHVVAPLREPAADADPLTPRQRQVLRLVAEGLPNKAIARALGISERTAKFHLSALFERLGAANRAQAVAIAAERGVLDRAEGR